MLPETGVVRKPRGMPERGSSPELLENLQVLKENPSCTLTQYLLCLDLMVLSAPHTMALAITTSTSILGKLFFIQSHTYLQNRKVA